MMPGLQDTLSNYACADYAQPDCRFHSDSSMNTDKYTDWYALQRINADIN
jgi:hypothetical protein